MFKDELTLIALNAKNKPSTRTKKAVNVFKKALRDAVQCDPFLKAVSFPIVGGKISCKNPLHNEPTCSIEDLPEIENAFNKEGLTMEWSYDRGYLNGTLTFKW